MSCEKVGIIDSLLLGVDSILGIRDSIGAVIRPVYLTTRTWYSDVAHTTPSTEVGGYAKDVSVQLLPSPQIVELYQDIKAREGGSVKNGDIMLKMISRNLYKEADLDGKSPAKNIEKLYQVGVKFYQVVKITESYVTWNVTLKELTNQTRY